MMFLYILSELKVMHLKDKLHIINLVAKLNVVKLNKQLHICNSYACLICTQSGSDENPSIN